MDGKKKQGEQIGHGGSTLQKVEKQDEVEEFFIDKMEWIGWAFFLI